MYPGPPLPSDNHIRVLILEPGDPGSPVQCQLSATTIDSAPAYEALSYTWGDPEQCKTINVRETGADMYSEYVVTLNCFTALNRLRYKDRARTMWIDAICIDQSAISERSHQVTLMSEIYSRANQVIVYLGEAEADSDLALDYILDIDTAESESSLTFPKSDTLAQAVNTLFQRPWFHRVWVVQEIVFASQATVVCGAKALDWRTVKNFRQWAARTAWINELPFVVSVSILGAIERERGFPLTVLEKLERARHCRATDPRDKIYALLPFLRAEGFNADFAPDYSKSIAQVFTECAAYLIVQSGFDVLRAVQSPYDDDALPSWVPDWSVPAIRGERESLSCRGSTHSPAGDQHPHQLRVLGDGSAVAHSVKSHNQGLALQAFGRCGGHVISLGSPYVAGQGPFPRDEWQATFTSTLGSREPSFLEYRELSYVIGNEDEMRMFEEYEAEREGDDNLNDSWCQVVRKLADARKEENLPLAYTDIPFHLAVLYFAPSMRRMLQMTLKRCHNRRFFVTDTGFVGVGPPHLQLGDSLYRCFGTDATFAFRDNVEPMGESRVKHVTLVGNCYVRSLAQSDNETLSEVLECLHIT